MSPRNPAIAASIASSVTWLRRNLLRDITFSVLGGRGLAQPDGGGIGLRVAVSRPRILVARSMPMTSTPVAIGSSVPACPTRRVPKMRRQRPTTSWLVIRPACRRRQGRRSQRDRRQHQVPVHRPASRQRCSAADRRAWRRRSGSSIRTIPAEPESSTSNVMCASSKPSQRLVSGNQALYVASLAQNRIRSQCTPAATRPVRSVRPAG